MGLDNATNLGENYGSMIPQDIQSDKANIQFLILRQLDRTNWLKSVSLAGKSSRGEIVALLEGLRGSIEATELLMAPFLDEKTLKEMEVIADKLDKTYRFKDLTDGVVRSVRLLHQTKYTPKGEVLSKTYTLSYDINKYKKLLNKWALILSKNLGKANVTPGKKIEYEFKDNVKKTW